MARAQNRLHATRRHVAQCGIRFGRALLVAAAVGVGLGSAPAPAAGDERSATDILTNVAMLRRAAVEAVDEMLADAPIATGDVITVRPGNHHKSNWIVAEVLARALTTRGLRVHVLDAHPTASPGAVVPPEEDPADPTGEDAESAGVDAESAGEDMPSLVEQTQNEAVVTAEADSSDAASTGTWTPPPAAEPAPAAPLLSGGVERGRVLEFRIAQFGVSYVGEGRAFVLGPKRVTRAASVDIGGRLRRPNDTDVEWVGQGDAVRVDRVSRSQLAAYESDDYSSELPEGGGVMRYVEPVVVGGIVTGLVFLFYTNQN